MMYVKKINDNNIKNKIMEIDQITVLLSTIFTGIATIIYAWKGKKPE